MTPQLAAIAHQAQAWFEVERVKLVQALQRADERRNDLEARVAVLQRQKAELLEPASAPPRPTEQDLNQRGVGEEDLDAALVHRRRDREHQQAREQYRRRVADVDQALAQARAKLASVPGEEQQHREYALARAAELRHIAGQRAAVYWRALVRRHPNGPVLAARWTRWLPDVPSWAQDIESRSL